MKDFYIDGKLLIGIDHGYGNMKTRNSVFKSGVKKYGEDPAIATNVLQLDGMYYVIVDVVVRPEYQSKRIGATIVNRLVEMIQNDAPEGSRVSIQLLAAKGKEEFYVKQGFKILPHEFCGPALRKVIYT